MDYYQYLPEAISFCCDVKRKLRMFNLISGMNKQTRRNFLKLIQNQNQKEIFIIRRLELEKKNDFLELKFSLPDNEIIKTGTINNYIHAINKFWNEEITLLEGDRFIELELGHTSKFKHVDDKVKFEIEFSPKRNNSCICNIDERELYFLINRLKLNNFRNDGQKYEYIKRQLLKKIFFNDLHVLINLDIIYSIEIGCLNAFLKENEFKYSIIIPDLNENDVKQNQIKLYDIELYNYEMKVQIKLNDLKHTDYLKLYLLITKRDRDIIKFNSEFYSQILLINEIDDLCEYDKAAIDQTVTFIRNNLVNYMNIQVIASINCPDLFQFNNKSNFILEIYPQKDSVDKVALRNYENFVNSSIRDEINYLNEKKNKNDNSLVNALKKENKESNEEILNLKRENEHFKETVKKKDDEIEAFLSEKEILNKKIEDFDRNQRLVIENNPPIQTVQTFSDKSSPSNVSMEIAEFLNKFQNRSKNI